MRLLIDFFPIALFVVAYRMADIYAATGVLMAATVLQTGLLYAIERRVAAVQKATLALILIFGALTLSLHDERFIQWKPTVLYTALALVLLGALSQAMPTVAACAPEASSKDAKRTSASCLIFFMVSFSSSVSNKGHALRHRLEGAKATPPRHQQEKAEVKQGANLRDALIDE